jgi:hypothetical protein
MEWTMSLGIERDLIPTCRHFPECPFTPPPNGECEGCQAAEQYLDDNLVDNFKPTPTSLNTRL